jgi:hypothetical protein
MEIILAIIGMLKTLESLVKMVRKKHDERLNTVNFTKVKGLHVVQKININKVIVIRHYICLLKVW